MERLTKYSNDLIRNKAVNILRKLDSENGLNCDELAIISSFCLIERVENKELKKYEDLEEQGKLLKLPCAVGDILYYPYINEDGERKIEELEVADVSAKLYQKQDGAWDSLEEIGEEVFLTRPEAERALAEMEWKK